MSSFFQERADVFADPIGHGNGESAFAGHIEVGACVEVGLGTIGIHRDMASARDDFHALRRSCAEVVGARVDQAECLAGSIREADGVGYDAAVKVDVGFGVDGNVGERAHALGMFGGRVG
jgi:hypothetical protein